MTGETLDSLEQQVQFYKNKPWTVVMTFDPETSKYIVMLPDFELANVADNRADAISMVEDGLDETIRNYLEEGLTIPEVQARQPEEFFPQSEDSPFGA